MSYRTNPDVLITNQNTITNQIIISLIFYLFLKKLPTQIYIKLYNITDNFFSKKYTTKLLKTCLYNFLIKPASIKPNNSLKKKPILIKSLNKHRSYFYNTFPKLNKSAIIHSLIKLVFYNTYLLYKLNISLKKSLYKIKESSFFFKKIFFFQILVKITLIF
jgi:hypothetical protein